MKTAKIGEHERLQGQAADSQHPGTGFSMLPDAVFGLIWGNLDQGSQHRFMQCSKTVAQSPAVLALITKLSSSSNTETRLGSFPFRAVLRQLDVRHAGVPAFLEAALGDRKSSQKLRTLTSFVAAVSARASEKRGLDVGCMGMGQGLVAPCLCL